jgi:hypothetical protein
MGEEIVLNVLKKNIKKKMKKFSTINEAKYFTPDPSVIKKYAGFIIPLYIFGKLKYEDVLLDEYLELYKRQVKDKNMNVLCDLEVIAVRAVLQENPMTPAGYETLKKEIENKCPKLERFLRTYIIDSKTYLG